MSAYEVHMPRNIREAVGLMASLEDAYFVSGGTKLVPLIKQKKIVPKHLISLGDLADLRHIKDGNTLRLGSSATLSEVENDDFIRRHYTALFDAVCHLGSPTIRKTATIGGTICNTRPDMHLACSLLLFDPDVAVAGMSPPTHQYGMEGEGGFLYGRFMGIEGFFVDGSMGALKKEELVKEFVLSARGGQAGSVYIKVGQRKAESLGIKGAGVRVEIGAGSDLVLPREALTGMKTLSDILSSFQKGGVTVKEARIVVGRPVEAPIRMTDTEKALEGRILCKDVFDEVLGAAQSEVVPQTVPAIDRWYGTEILKMLLKRAVIKAIDRAIRPNEKIRPESVW